MLYMCLPCDEHVSVIIAAGMQASSLISGSGLVPAQFVLLSAYIELASGKIIIFIGRNRVS